MPNPYGVPDISPQQVAEKRAKQEAFILLDVREPHELNYANLGDGVTLVPVSQIAQKQMAALPDDITGDKNAQIVVFCHHGGRSAQVAAWLRQHGWNNVYNMDGGIDAYARMVDAGVGRY